MITLKLFFEFFKIGLFAIGGGLATIPFLYDLSSKTNWFDHLDISNMIAISESTPGPLGINMATYTGFLSNGILGGIIATLGLITPSIIIIIIVSKFLEKFSKNELVKKIFYGLRAGVLALILATGLNILKNTILGGKFVIKPLETIIFATTLFLLQKTKFHPILFIVICAILGIIFKL